MSKDYKKFILDSKTITDKNEALDNFIFSAINKMQSMFTYTGLPDTIPQKWLEYYLMTNGNAFITKVNGDLYAFVGGLGGVYDAYYQPTKCIVNNPYLNFNKDLEVDKDGVLIRNDTLMIGMLPTLRKYGVLLTESDITIRMALINLRIFNTISAPDDSSKQGADEYLRKIENGELASIGDSAFFDGIKMHTNTNISGYLTQLIEMTQYIKASFYNEIGLNANYNLKREYISTTENSLADDILLPLCDNMLAERKEGLEKVNAMYGTDIRVEFNSSWKANNTQNEKEIADNESTISTDTNAPSEPETNESEPNTNESEPNGDENNVTE